MLYLIRQRAIITIVVTCLSLGGLGAQFSKFHDLQIGNGNYPVDFLIYGDSYFTISLHICDDASRCTIICKIDQEGNVTDTLIIEGFYAGSYSPLVLVDSVFIVSGHQLDSLSVSPFAIVNIDLNEAEIIDVNNDMVHFINGGMMGGTGGSMITYGSVYHPGEGKYGGYITTWEADLSAVSKNMVFDLEEVHLGVYELHQLDSALYSFSSFDRRPEVDYYFIHELHDDTLKLVYSYKGWTATSPNPTLLVDKHGNYYFGSFYHPQMIWPPSTGRLNKVSSVTQDLEWSLILPSTPFDFRSYDVQDIIETQAGNIVACGTIEDSDELGYATTGFVVSVTPTGILNWLRFFKFPNYINPTMLGAYRRSSLSKIKEDTNGGLIGFGYSYQFSASSVPLMQLWILGLDENGCLMPDSCEEISIITNQHNIENVQDDLIVYPNPVQDNLYFSNAEECNFSIWDANMTLVKAGTVQESISLSDLPAALYIVRIDATGSAPKFVKIIKIK